MNFPRDSKEARLMLDDCIVKLNPSETPEKLANALRNTYGPNPAIGILQTAIDKINEGAR